MGVRLMYAPSSWSAARHGRTRNAAARCSGCMRHDELSCHHNAHTSRTWATGAVRLRIWAISAMASLHRIVRAPVPAAASLAVCVCARSRLAAAPSPVSRGAGLTVCTTRMHEHTPWRTCDQQHVCARNYPSRDCCGSQTKTVTRVPAFCCGLELCLRNLCERWRCLQSSWWSQSRKSRARRW